MLSGSIELTPSHQLFSLHLLTLSEHNRFHHLTLTIHNIMIGHLMICQDLRDEVDSIYSVSGKKVIITDVLANILDQLRVLAPDVELSASWSSCAGL